MFTPAFAQTSFTSLSNSEYVLKIDEHTYPIQYHANADVIAMQIDSESKSLLIGLEHTIDSEFSITLNSEMINAPNNEYVVLVDGQDVDYDITSNSDMFTLTFFIPVDTEEIEIIGTNVIPEFPLSSIFVLMIVTASVVIFAKIRMPFFKL